MTKRDRAVQVLGILLFVGVAAFGILCMAGLVTIHNANTGQVDHQVLTRVVFGGIYVVIGLAAAGGFAVALHQGVWREPEPPNRPDSSTDADTDIGEAAWDGFH